MNTQTETKTVKHTPGPWTVQPDPEWAGKHAFHNSRFITAGPDLLNADEWGENPDNLIVCSLRDCSNQAANAALIAAAPELLDALIECGNALIDALPGGHPDFAIVQKARAAIAKAQGEKV